MKNDEGNLSTPIPPQRPRDRCWVAVAAMALLAVVAPCSLAAVGEKASPPAPQLSLGEPTADITFPSPKRYAVFQLEPEKVRRIFTAGDVLFHPKDPTRYVLIQRVDPEGILLRHNGKGPDVALRLGDALPGFSTVTLLNTVVLNRLQYRFRNVQRTPQPEPILVSITGSLALLEKEISGLSPDRRPPGLESPSGQPKTLGPDPTLVERIRLEALDQNTYGLYATDLKPVIEQVGQLMAGLEPLLAPATSALGARTMNLSSSVADATLSHRGFTVTNIKVAQFFGIQVGDTITSLNGLPVNSPLNAWLTFQEIFIRNPTLQEIRLEMIREGRQTVKMYRIR